MRVGDFAGTARLYEKSLTIKRESENRHGIATALDNLANVRGYLGDWSGGAMLYEERLQHWRALGDLQNVARTLANHGEACHHLGENT